MISVSSFIRMPMLRRKACVRASVLDMESENTSLEAIMVKGTSFPRFWAMPSIWDQTLVRAMNEMWGLTHCDGCFARTGGSSHEDSLTGYPALLDHLDNKPCCLACFRLTDHSLRVCARFESVVETKTADVGMCTCAKKRVRTTTEKA